MKKIGLLLVNAKKITLHLAVKTQAMQRHTSFYFYYFYFGTPAKGEGICKF